MSVSAYPLVNALPVCTVKTRSKYRDSDLVLGDQPAHRFKHLDRRKLAQTADPGYVANQASLSSQLGRNVRAAVIDLEFGQLTFGAHSGRSKLLV